VLPAADEILDALVSAASYFGIQSLVAPMLALRAARAAAALAGRDYITAEDAQLAARLVLAPRALVNPEPEEAEAAPEPNASPQEPPPANNDSQSDSEMPEDLLEDLVLAAVRAALPPGLLDTLKKSAGDRSPPSRRKGTGAMQATLSRGRPAGVRMGPMRSGARLALVETLRAAAPWQRLRQAANKNGVRRVEIRPEDFRIKTFAIPRESTIIFCVDASGSSAFHRLAWRPRAPLSFCWARPMPRRTYAALIAFRGAGSDMLLPPSRSLARAKALLSMLPGGGGTPLAAGIDAAILTAVAERAKGRSPLIVFLTDGQANIARGGQAGRTAAFAEAMAAATGMAMQRLAGIFVDTAQRPREEGAKLARAMGARYLALPYAQASAMRDVIRAAMP
jgi:magnesium chelatase subunit D